MKSLPKLLNKNISNKTLNNLAEMLEQKIEYLRPKSHDTEEQKEYLMRLEITLDALLEELTNPTK